MKKTAGVHRCDIVLLPVAGRKYRLCSEFYSGCYRGLWFTHEAFPYNPMADKGLVAVISAASQGNWQEGGMSGEWSVAAAAYGSNISYDGIGSPYLLGYGIEPWRKQWVLSPVQNHGSLHGA